MNDAELEEAFRASLRTRAADVDAPPGLVARAGAARPRRRRTTVWAAVGAAAAVVVVSLGLQAVHLPSHQEQGVSDRGSATSSGSDPDSSASSSVGDVAGWREESWHGLQVEVPADWGWGTAPIRQGGQPYLCGGPGAKVLAGGRDLESADVGTAYVGRPIMLSDACQGGDVITGPPAAPYVWLGADLPAGTVDLGDGYTQETVEEHGTTVTVATDDASLRQQILASAAASACPDDVVGQLPQAYAVGPAGGEIQSAGMCVFQRSGASTLQLVYSDMLDAGQARAYYRAAQQARRPGTLADALGAFDSCPTDELAVVRLTLTRGSATWVRNTVVNLDCGWVTTHAGDYRTLDDATRRSITGIGGLRAVLASEVGTLG